MWFHQNSENCRRCCRDGVVPFSLKQQKRYPRKLWTVENFGWGALPPRPAELCPPRTPPPLKRSFVTFDRGGQTGPPRSNDFFSAPLTTRAPPTTVRRPSDDRPPAPRNHVTPCSCYPQYRELSLIGRGQGCLLGEPGGSRSCTTGACQRQAVLTRLGRAQVEK